MTSSATHVLPDQLVALCRDDDRVVRAVGIAIVRTVVDDLDADERRWVLTIEGLRATLDASTEPIDTAFSNTRGVTKPMPIGEVAARRSKKGPWALVLLALARELRPHRMLELGTCLGVSGAFLAAGADLNGTGSLTTLEGAPALAVRAGQHLHRLGLTAAEVVPGLFRETLPEVLERGQFDLAFVDGHHDEAATQAYFEQLLPHLTDPAVVVFDDIAWSDGMARAWDGLRRHHAVRVAVDLDRIGVCVVGAGGGARQVVLPKLTTMAASVGRVAAGAR